MADKASIVTGDAVVMMQGVACCDGGEGKVDEGADVGSVTGQ